MQSPAREVYAENEGTKWARPALAFTLASAVVAALTAAANSSDASPEKTADALLQALQLSGSTVGLSAISGFAAMTLVESLKQFLRLRGDFHYEFLLKLSSSTNINYLRLLVPHQTMTRSDWVSRLDQPLEQICAQLSRSIDRGLSSQSSGTGADPDLRIALTTLYLDHDVPITLHRLRVAAEDLRNEPDFRNILELLTYAIGAPNGLHSNELRNAIEIAAYHLEFEDLHQEQVEKLRRLIDLGSEPSVDLHFAAESHIDEIQLAAGSGWQMRIKLFAGVLSALIAAITAFMLQLGPTGIAGAALPAFLIGGVLAGAFRDVLYGISRLARR